MTDTQIDTMGNAPRRVPVNQGDVLITLEAFEQDREALRPVLKRLVERERFSTEKAEAAQGEFLKFVSVLKAEGGPLSPSGLADEFWHAFILHSRPYAAWCERHFGRFVHHIPNDGTDLLDGRAVLCRSISLMQKHFGTTIGFTSNICNSNADCGGVG